MSIILGFPVNEFNDGGYEWRMNNAYLNLVNAIKGYDVKVFLPHLEAKCPIKSHFESIQLTRDCQDEIPGANRSLPYIKELLALLGSKSFNDDDMIGFINNDALVGKKFFKALSNPDNDLIFARRTDVSSTEDFRLLDEDKAAKGPIVPRSCNSIDAFFIKAKYLEMFLSDYPEFILGEPYWDTYVLTLSAAKYVKKPFNMIVADLHNNELCHLFHESFWLRHSIQKNHIVNLYNDNVKKLMDKHPDYDGYYMDASEGGFVARSGTH